MTAVVDPWTEARAVRISHRWAPALAALRAAVVWLSSLRHLSMVAGLSLTAHAHWYLAVEVLHFPVLLGWTLPLAVDAYLLAALRAWTESPDRRHRDLVWALILDGVAVAGSHAASQVDVPAPWRAGLAAAVGVIVVLAMWRAHALDVVARRTAPRRQRHEPPVAVTAAVAPVASPQVAPTIDVGAPRDAVLRSGPAAAGRGAPSPSGGDRQARAVELHAEGLDEREAKRRLMADGVPESTARRICKRVWADGSAE